MYGVLTYIYLKNQLNVGRYTIPMDPSWDWLADKDFTSGDPSRLPLEGPEQVKLVNIGDNDPFKGYSISSLI